MDAELAREAEEFWQDLSRELDEEALREMDSRPPVAPHPPQPPQVASAGGSCQAAAVPPKVPGQQYPAGHSARALQATCGDEGLKPLLAAARRTNMHFTHVRTRDPSHIQPSSLTRQQAWAHLERVYQEAYPDADSPTGSILRFGAVVKERHEAAETDGCRAEHHHCIAYCSKQHYWNKLANISLQKYKIPLSAVEHSSYTQMWRYIREPSSKKPLAELDAEVYLSPLHPRDQELAQFLGVSERCQALNEKRGQGAGGGWKKRARPSVFLIAQERGIRTAAAFQQAACADAAAGDTTLAEFATQQGKKLQILLDNAWAVLEAPQRALESGLSLLDKLRRAAATMPCSCEGRWPQGAARVLENAGLASSAVCGAVVKALQMGAVRGMNIAFVGKGGAGKSMLLEPFVQIFAVAGKPQKGSSFPLAGLLTADVILWQDYKHHEPTLSFTDLLSLVVGESVDVRIPGEVGVPFRNKAPMFYSGRGPIAFTTQDQGEKDDYNEMMGERFTVFHFGRGLPKEERSPNFPQCGRCCALFFLTHGAPAAGASALLPEREAWSDGVASLQGLPSIGGSSAGGASSSSLLAPASHQDGGRCEAMPASLHSLLAPAPQLGSARSEAMLVALREAAQMHASGVLDASEFAAAKRRILSA